MICNLRRPAGGVLQLAIVNLTGTSVAVSGDLDDTTIRLPHRTPAFALSV